MAKKQKQFSLTKQETNNLEIVTRLIEEYSIRQQVATIAKSALIRDVYYRLSLPVDTVSNLDLKSGQMTIEVEEKPNKKKK